MDDFIQIMVKMAIADAMKNGVKMPNTNNSVKDDITKADALAMAKTNKMFYDAHIEAGFTADQAILIVAALNN